MPCVDTSNRIVTASKETVLCRRDLQIPCGDNSRPKTPQGRFPRGELGNQCFVKQICCGPAHFAAIGRGRSVRLCRHSETAPRVLPSACGHACGCRRIPDLPASSLPDRERGRWVGGSGTGLAPVVAVCGRCTCRSLVRKREKHIPSLSILPLRKRLLELACLILC